MKAHLAILLLASTLCSGCSGFTRLITGTVAAGGGAYVANQLSDGDPLITAAGAGAGLLLSEAANHAGQQAAERARRDGYDKGRSDAVKQQYWIMVNQQKTVAGLDQDISLYEVPIPEQEIDGVILQPTTRVLRIQE